jgi:hypothetical protein
VLAFGGKIACAGGTDVAFGCATKTTPAEFSQCVGPAGPVGCPYCIDHSCLHAGLCGSDNDCHRGDVCMAGLCRVVAPECPMVLGLDQVVAGKFAAGKELCVRGPVVSVRPGYDGMTEIRLGDQPFVYIDLAPMYEAAGLRRPAVGETITAHGTIRWDAGHGDWELLPVDWIQ